MSYTIHNGNCLDVMTTLPDNSVDSIVTDPPYGLSFMGKDWDHGVPGTHFWAEALRVAKPGAHLLAFGGTRTYHRLACAIEDAGWEIRDCLGWLYGSGFPKSHNISKAIDMGQGENRARQLRFTEWMRSTGMTASAANVILQRSGAISENGTMAGHYFDKTQPAIATADLFDKLRPHLPPVPEEIERLVADRTGIEWTDYVKREKVGVSSATRLAVAPGCENDRSAVTLDITAPATDLARQWDGWGTALKPAWEPIILARKPLVGTVAQNVTEWGTGGLNIDGCRVEVAAGDEPSAGNRTATFGTQETVSGGDGSGGWQPTPLGRFPANIIHDGSDEVLSVFPNDSSRFFYCAKASKSDRNDGLDGFEERVGGGMNATETQTMLTGSGNTRSNLRKNHHPTVKPTDLMAYCCRLVTPPNGVVLDPFMGSGSTGRGAVRDGFDFIGIDLDADYCAIAEARIQASTK